MSEKTYKSLLEKITASCRLIAVSKTQSVDKIKDLYNWGQRDFGENKVQELLGKKDQLPSDIRWHMIGNLQRNKVKYLTDFAHLIHSVDSQKLMKEINKEATKSQRKMSVLLQVKIAKEDSKEGMETAELDAILQDFVDDKYPMIEIKGLMGMATFTDDVGLVEKEFAALRSMRDDRITQYPFLQELSMGMSGDFTMAIEQGSTMVRIGSLIFGARDQ